MQYRLFMQYVIHLANVNILTFRQFIHLADVKYAKHFNLDNFCSLYI
jgi:hypothetical protein